MRWLLLLLAATGCNQLFEIQQTNLVDAPPEPDEPDAAPPPECPPIGTKPHFASSIDPMQARRVLGYSVDAAQQIAAGFGIDAAFGGYAVFVGPITEQPVVQKIEPLAGPIAHARLAPEGDALFVAYYSAGGGLTFSELRDVGGIWSQQGASFQIPGFELTFPTLSTPTFGPVRRFVAAGYAPSSPQNVLVELEYDGATATLVSSTTTASLGLQFMDQLSLSPDGLRLVFTGGNAGRATNETDVGDGEIEDATVYYLDRPSLDAPFAGPVQPLDSVPLFVGWPYMTADCGRMYFSALDNVWYVELAR